MDSEHEVIEIMKSNKIDYVLTLPCDKVKDLLRLIPGKFKHLPLTREEDGVGIAAGLAIAGKRPLMLVQSSGIGNMVNALCSLTAVYELPLPVLVSWRGVYNEKIPAQVPMGKHLPGVLDAIDVRYEIIDSQSRINLVGKVIQESFGKSRIYAALLSPKIWDGGINKKVDNVLDNIHPCETKARAVVRTPEPGTSYPRAPELTRYEIISSIVPFIDGKVVVSNIGIPSKELYSIHDQASNFYMLGSFGLASSIGLGIALGTNRRVIVIDGDGSLLANPNVLCTIAQENPKNLAVLCIDNGVHGSTGNQPTAASRFVDLSLVARSFGISNTMKAQTEREVISAFNKCGLGPSFIHAIAKAGNENVPEIPLKPVDIKTRVAKFLQKSC